MNDILLSWAVPKGTSLNPTVKRLAMHVEDDPVSYIDFEVTIPAGNYDAGTVEVWNYGKYIPVDEIVLVDEDGKPDFQKLQHYESNNEYPLVYYMFDILMFEGEGLKYIPLAERKKLLKKCWEKTQP